MASKGPLVILALLFAVIQVRAQESSINVIVGYGFPAGTKEIYSNVSMSGSSTTTSPTDGSYGAGFNLGVSYWVMFSKRVGMELGVTYLFGREWEGKQKSAYQNDEVSSSLSGFFLSPVLVFKLNPWGSIKPYLKAGASIAFVSIDEKGSSSYNDGMAVGQLDFMFEYRGGPAFGFRGGAGFSYDIGAGVEVFAELIYNPINYYPAEGELTYLVINNNGKLGQMSTSQKQVRYVEGASGVSSTSPDEPSTAPQLELPLSSIQLNTGLRFMLRKKSKPGQ